MTLYLHPYGDGPHLALALHGWAGTHSTFAAVAAHLPPELTLLSADKPGYGRSDDPRAWTLDDLTQTLIDGLEGRLDRPCALIGNCSGAIIALLLCQARPQWFQRLILVEPFAYTPWYFRLFLWPVLGRFFYWNAFENPLGRWLTDAALRDQRAGGEDLASGFVGTRARTALGYLRLLGAMREPGQFASLGVPVTLIYGGRTLGAVKESVEVWRGVWPDADVHRIEGAGHLVLQERPQEAAALLAAAITSPR